MLPAVLPMPAERVLSRSRDCSCRLCVTHSPNLRPLLPSTPSARSPASVPASSASPTAPPWPRSDEIEHSLPKEMDFRVEAANAARTSAMFAHRADVVCPRVYGELSTARVLVMSFEPGCYANDLPAICGAGLDPADVARVVAEAFAEQLFIRGWVHCDPHPANVLVRAMSGGGSGGGGKKRPQIVLLDHGLYRDIRHLRMDYARMWSSILKGALRDRMCVGCAGTCLCRRAPARGLVRRRVPPLHRSSPLSCHRLHPAPRFPAGDEGGIKRYAERLGAGGMYTLFASMLTTRTVR